MYVAREDTALIQSKSLMSRKRQYSSLCLFYAGFGLIGLLLFGAPLFSAVGHAFQNREPQRLISHDALMTLNEASILRTPMDPSVMVFTIKSSAFNNGGDIPSIYSRCDGEDRSPPLEWSNVPPNTQSLALIVDDPDAPDPAKPKLTWVHWVLYNLPPSSSGLPEGVEKQGLPEGTMEARNDWKHTGYGGPSPPIGKHRYFFKLYALDTVLPNLGSSATKKTVVDAMQGHILAEAEHIGKYQKGGK